jgi:hypothetical protein
MARYKALNLLYIRREVLPGEEFESDLPPGRNWQPLDDEARAAVKRVHGENAAVLKEAAKIDRSLPAPAAVDIPDGWQNLSGQARRFLAMRLGAPSTVKAIEANGFIETELDRRGQRAAA